MEDIKIEFAENSDMQEILNIKKQSHEYFVISRPDIYKESKMLYTEDFLYSFFNSIYKHIVVAKIKNQIIGYAFIQMMKVDLPMLTSRKYMYVHDMAVSEEYRHHGVATKLLNYIENYSLNMGATKLELAVHLFNRNAISLYENIGFNARSIRMEKDLYHFENNEYRI